MAPNQFICSKLTNFIYAETDSACPNSLINKVLTKSEDTYTEMKLREFHSSTYGC